VRERNGTGQYIDISMIDILVSWMSVRAGDFLLGGRLPKKPTEMSHLSPANAVFLAKDKKGISIGALEDVFWKRLCKVLQIDQLSQNDDFSNNGKRVKHSRKIYAMLQKAFAQKNRDEWIGLLDQAGVPCGPVYFYDETFEDLHIRDRELFLTMPYRGKKLKQVRFPAIFSDLRTTVYLPPPEVGEHTDAVLRDAGFSSANIRRLGEQGVFGVEFLE
jgi:formyl-CoA transferase